MHLYTYLAIALAFSHQLATGQGVRRRPARPRVLAALYVVTLAALVVFRFGVPAFAARATGCGSSV